MVRYLHPADNQPTRVIKAGKDFCKKKHGFLRDKIFDKIRDIHKIGKSNSITISVLIMKTRQNMQSMYQKKIWLKHVDLFLTGKEDKRHYVFTKDLSHL